MADHAAWAVGYARQAQADFQTFEKLQAMPVPECHKLQFLQMACEKLVKAHLCSDKADPSGLQTSHAYVAKTLPVVLRQQAEFIKYEGAAARKTLQGVGTDHEKRFSRTLDDPGTPAEAKGVLFMRFRLHFESEKDPPSSEVRDRRYLSAFLLRLMAPRHRAKPVKKTSVFFTVTVVEQLDCK
jgi:hypothetical protein